MKRTTVNGLILLAPLIYILINSVNLFAFETIELHGNQNLTNPFEYDLNGDNKKEKIYFTKIEDKKVIYEVYEILTHTQRKEIFRIPIGGYHKGQIISHEYSSFGISNFVDINNDNLIDMFYSLGDENGNIYFFIFNMGSFTFKVIGFDELNNIFRSKIGIELWEMDDVHWYLQKNTSNENINIRISAGGDYAEMISNLNQNNLTFDIISFAIKEKKSRGTSGLPH